MIYFAVDHTWYDSVGIKLLPKSHEARGIALLLPINFIVCFNNNNNNNNRIMYDLSWLLIFLSRVRRFGNDFYEWWSHEWKSMPNRLPSDKKNHDIHGKPYIILFLHDILCTDWAHRPAKKSSIAHFTIFAKDSLFLLVIGTSPQCNLWRHANTTYRHCDVIFLDCSSTGKLAQRWSWLVINNREDRYLIIP